MADRISLTLQPRATLGKKVKGLRRAGVAPVHLYGRGVAPQALQCQEKELLRALARAGGNSPIVITVEGTGEEHLAFAREIQWDPIKGALFHVDFLRAEADRLVSAEVPIVLTGDSPGARKISGTVVQQLRTVTVEALPLDMPGDINIDLSVMAEPEDVIRAQDIPLPTGTNLITDPEAMVARIELAKVEVVEGAEVTEAPSAEESTQEEG